MNYQFESKVTPADLWLVMMRRIYHSPIAMCNVVFTVAMFLLTAKFFGESSDVIRVILILLCMIFPVFQPAGVYARAKGQVATLPQGLTFTFDDWGIHIRTGKQEEDLAWKNVRGIQKEKNMIIIYSDKARGFMFPNKVLGSVREQFYEEVNDRIRHERKAK